MVGKLFKYEIKYLLRWMIPICAGIIGLAALCKLASLFGSGIVSTLIQMSLYYVYSLGINAMIVLGYVIVAIRFLRSTFTQEAYFTHTIPVSGTALLNVKLLSGWLFILAIYVSAAIAHVLMLSQLVFSDFFTSIPFGNDGFFGLTAAQIAVLAVELALLLLFGSLVEILHPYAACSLGQMMKSKVGGAVMWFFIIGGVLEALGSFAYVFGIVYLAFNEGVVLFPVAVMVLGIAILAVIAIDVTFYLITRYRIRNKLNI